MKAKSCEQVKSRIGKIDENIHNYEIKKGILVKPEYTDYAGQDRCDAMIKRLEREKNKLQKQLQECGK